MHINEFNNIHRESIYSKHLESLTVEKKKEQGRKLTKLDRGLAQTNTMMYSKLMSMVNLSSYYQWSPLKNTC